MSNILEFDIVEADAPWQRQTLSRAVAALDDPTTSKDEKDAAEQTLRFLDSPESVRELARQLTKPGSQQTWNFTAGLIGARNQELALKELQSRLAAPDAALTHDYLWLLAKMQFARAHAPLPPYPENDPTKENEWQAKAEKLSTEWTKAQDALYEDAADFLGFKEGAARASTVATILAEPRGLDHITLLSDAEIAAAFPLLDEKQQSTILSVFSSRVTSPLMTGPLEALLDRPKISDTLLRINTLQTLLKVNPKEGRARILAEIKEPHADSLSNSTFLATCLNGLPDNELSELDELLIKRLERHGGQTRDLDAALIGRYATEAILEKVKTLYLSEPESWDCAATDGFIRYFLRLDYQYGLSVFSKEGSFCTTESLKEIAEMGRWPDVQPIFVKRLYDANPWQARSAAEVLGQWGDSGAKEALLIRLRAFNKTWKARENEFRFLSPSKDIGEAMALQSQLITSLTYAASWKLTDDEKTEVNGLTLPATR